MEMARTVQYKNWCFTVNGEEPQVQSFYDSLEKPELATYMVVGLERGSQDGRLHLQGYIQLAHKMRLRTIKTWGGFWSTAHLEPQKARGPQGNQKARDYCMEDGVFKEFGEFSGTTQGKRSDILEAQTAINNGATWADMMRDHFGVMARHSNFIRQAIALRDQVTVETQLQASLRDAVLRPWQQRLLTMVQGDAHPREVVWMWETQGNVGKSWMAKYLSVMEDALVLEPGRKMDLAYIYSQNQKRITIFDLARTAAPDPDSRNSPLDVIYSVMESLKNGYLISTKYESRMLHFPTPHVIVFANFEPDYTKMSADRYNVIKIE